MRMQEACGLLNLLEHHIESVLELRLQPAQKRTSVRNLQHRLSRRAVIVFAALAALVAGPGISRAQDLSTGALNITVQDSTGAAVNGAQVQLTDPATNNVRSVATKGAGDAVLSFLPPARYQLTVSKNGFESKVYPSVTVQTNQTTDLRVTLVVGATTQSVSVSGD